MKKTKVAGAAALSALLVSGTAPAVQAIEVDTAPPELVSFEVTPSLIDAREGGTVTATVHITDETCLDDSPPSLFNAGEPTLSLNNTADNAYGSLQRGVLISGDCQDGIYEASFPISADALGIQPFGDWNVTIYPLTDSLGNSAGLDHPSFFGERFFTYAASPDAVAGLQIGSASTTAVSASWSAPDANGSPISKYVVDVSNALGDVVATETVTSTSAGLAVDLAAGEAYTLAVTAYNEVGGTQAAEAAFTAAATPVTPEAPVFVDEDGTAEDTYTIPATANVQYLLNGEVVAAGTYEATGTVTITAQPAAGYAFPADTTATWEETFVAATYVTPEAPVFTDELGTADDSYTIPAVAGVEYLVDGEVVAAGTYEATGTVTITARVVEGYMVADGGEIDWTNEFSTADVNPFVDMEPDDTFYAEILWMAENGISGGWATDEGKVYRPHEEVDRDVMAAFLYRLAGSPEYTAPEQPPFLDVSTEDAFYKEMAWMAEADISGGWDVGTGKEYRPHTAVDRDVMAAFLYRMAGSPEFTAPVESPFLDVAPGANFYKEMAWMAEADISGGWDVGTGKEYRPHVAVDRDVMAAFLYRLNAVL